MVLAWLDAGAPCTLTENVVPVTDPTYGSSAAVAEFVARYNNHWRLEKLGFLSPAEARAALNQKLAA